MLGKIPETHIPETHIPETHFAAAEDSRPSAPAASNQPNNLPGHHISGLNHIPPQDFGPPFLPDLFGKGKAPDPRPDPNNENLNEPINTTEDPQVTASKTPFLKKLFTPKNGGPAPALPGALTGAQIGTDVGGALGHVASLSDVVGPTAGIVGNALGAGTALSRIEETKLQKTNLNQVRGQIPKGPPYNDVMNEAEYAFSQTDKRLGRLYRQVVGNGVSFASNTVSIASGGTSLPVTGPTSAVGFALSGTIPKVYDYLKKGKAVGADRNAHATNLLNMLGDAPAGKNTPVSQYHAEQVVKALGLDPNDLRSNPNAQKLIFDKLSSW